MEAEGGQRRQVQRLAPAGVARLRQPRALAAARAGAVGAWGQAGVGRRLLRRRELTRREQLGADGLGRARPAAGDALQQRAGGPERRGGGAQLASLALQPLGLLLPEGAG